MRFRLGLRARMAASYVLVTCAAVIVVEALVFWLVVPNANQEADLASRVVNTANRYTRDYGGALVKSNTQASDPEARTQFLMSLLNNATVPLGDPGNYKAVGPGWVQDLDQGIVVPHVDGILPDSAPMSLMLILSPTGQIYGSSYPGRYAPDTSAVDRLPAEWDSGGSSVTKLWDGKVAWASEPVLAASSSAGKPPPLGFVYVQAPIPNGGGLSHADSQTVTTSSLIFLLVTIPVGVLFGLLTTSGTVRRLRRLAAGTVGFAAGDFAQRVPESGSDEVGQLERHFNRMAGRLSDSIEEQRALAERNARLAERSRISRELHDSISQDLFSISALAGGLRKALPPESGVHAELETLSRTVSSTIQEMRALLLELRPTALEEKGLGPALADLCEAYEVRVGVSVQRDLQAVTLGPAAELAVLRIAQEGLSNAARHSEADRIQVRLRPAGDTAELTVADNGRGFDRTAAGNHGLGLRLMAERVRELGGSLTIDSEPGGGTRLRVLLPVAAG